ncbi:MAG: GntR family transcriptional regulator [Rhizobiaceae bacterium]|nr:GntR family transcriptional regulator [Rhizobiaceae bacterium]
MNTFSQVRDRRTSVDMVFEHLYDEIVSLNLLPGDKISEAEIASKFGLSRQPVRDAFSRLENLDLLLIRPQKATEVRRFSTQEITKSRFVRACIEKEVLRRAAQHCTDADAALMDAALAEQEIAVKERDYEKFGDLDYEFHHLLCKIANVEFAFEVIAFEKAKVDRLCVLSISKEDRMGTLVEDHRKIAEHIRNGNGEGAVEVGMTHLSRLDDTIKSIFRNNPDYFDE